MKEKISLYKHCIDNNKEYLIEEWDDERNLEEFGLTMHDVTYGSGMKVWWKDNLDHRWLTKVLSRSQGSQCPYCSKTNAKVLVGFNDLLTTHPNISKEWHPVKNGDLKPTDVTQGSDFTAWWVNENSIEWDAKVASRTRKGDITTCYGKKFISGINDLATTNPNLASEWHPVKNGKLKVSDVKAGSAQKVWWKCEEGHEWEATINSRNNGSGCPHCKTQTSFVEQYIYHGLKTKFKNVTNRKKINGYEYDIYIKDINLLIEYDGYYYHRVLNNGEDREQKKQLNAKDLGYSFIRIREIPLRYKGILMATDSIVHINNNKIKNFNKLMDILIGYINKEFCLSIDSTISKDIKFIAEKSASTNITTNNSLRNMCPDIAKMWHPTKNMKLKPEDVSFGSGKEVYWLCKNGHVFKKRIASMTRCSRCPICELENNCIASRFPEIANKWHPTLNGNLKPTEVMANTMKRAYWKCDKGHVYDKTIPAMINTPSCPICKKEKREAKKKDSIIPMPQPSHQQQIHLN